MKYRFFSIPATTPDEAQETMNRFCEGNVSMNLMVVCTTGLCSLSWRERGKRAPGKINSTVYEG